MMNKFISAFDKLGTYIATWKKGAIKLLIMFMIAVLSPMVISYTVFSVITLPIAVLGFEIKLPDDFTIYLMILGVLVFGPNFVERYWDEITSLTKPSSQKAKPKSQVEPSPNINPNYDDRGRELNNTEKWLAVGFAIFCILAFIFF